MKIIIADVGVIELLIFMVSSFDSLMRELAVVVIVKFVSGNSGNKIVVVRSCYGRIRR